MAAMAAMMSAVAEEKMTTKVQLSFVIFSAVFRHVFCLFALHLGRFLPGAPNDGEVDAQRALPKPAKASGSKGSLSKGKGYPATVPLTFV